MSQTEYNKLIQGHADEEQVYTIYLQTGEPCTVWLYSKEDAIAINPLDCKLWEFGYTADGSVLIGERDMLFIVSTECTRAVRTPIETLTRRVPTMRTLLRYVSLVESGELFLDEIPARRFVPTYDDLVQCVESHRNGSISREGIARVATSFRETLEATDCEDRIWEALLYLCGIDLQQAPGVYLHDDREMAQWMQKLKRM